jgi:hypothetical protein
MRAQPRRSVPPLADAAPSWPARLQGGVTAVGVTAVATGAVTWADALRGPSDAGLVLVVVLAAAAVAAGVVGAVGLPLSAAIDARLGRRPVAATVAHAIAGALAGSIIGAVFGGWATAGALGALGTVTASVGAIVARSGRRWRARCAWTVVAVLAAALIAHVGQLGA